jgi:isopenicillin N synthase-like dioxygenase
VTHLPIIDLGALRKGDASSRIELSRELDTCCQDHGFFYVVGHGIEARLRESVFAQSRAFFALPVEVKSRWHIDRSRIRRGYDPVGWQSLEPGQPADLKESFYLGVDRSPDDPLVAACTPNHGPNQWPSESLVPGFQSDTQAYAAALSGVGLRLMGLLAQALNLTEAYFDPFYSDPMPVLRLLHYPPRAKALERGQAGCGAHTDWGSLTLLTQDEAGGLQVQMNGKWQDVPFMPDSLVVNLGDLMARWSNDRWHSTLHRVLPQPPGHHRYSIAYFFDINYHALVSVLPGCSDTLHPPRYEPITAGQHIVEMYQRTTLAPAL